MSEPTGGGLFFEATNNFASIPEAFANAASKTLSEYNSLVQGLSQAASRAENIEINPLGGALAAVTRDVEAIQARLLDLVRTYQELGRQNIKPPETFDVAAQRVVRQGTTQALSSFSTAAGATPGAEQVRQAIEQSLKSVGAQAGRDAWSSLRESLKGVVDDINAYVGATTNRLRANLITPETAAPTGTAAAAPTGTAAAAAQQRVLEERTNREAAAAAAAAPRVTESIPGQPARLPSAAQTKAAAKAAADAAGQAEAELKALQEGFLALNKKHFAEGIGSGRLLPLGSDIGRDKNTGIFESATHGVLSQSDPDHANDLRKATDAYTKHLGTRQKEGEQVLQAEAAEARAADSAAKAKVRQQTAADNLAAREQRSVDAALLRQNRSSFDQGLASGQIQDLTKYGGKGTGRDLNTGELYSRDLGRLSDSVAEHENALKTADEAAVKMRQGQIEAGNQTIKAERDLAAADERAAKATIRDEAKPKGVGQNLVSGFLSSGFGGGGAPTSINGIFDGLARSAGTTLKYTALYQVLGQLQGALTDVVKQFLDANDSVTELEVAMGHASEVTGGFVNSLGDVAAVGGFNVGEAMDVAASGIRAFGSQADDAVEANERLGTSFATQASRIAVLSKTSLTDAAGNLKAIAAGFNLPKNNLGFTQVSDAIAGAKLAGGGDEKQIGQGLANAALIFKQLGFSLNESATIISRINAETDESGTLIANRVSRLSQIIGGSSGKNFIASLNQTLSAKDRVDTQASVKDQLIQLAKVYKDATTAQKAQIVSALGGTAQARETIILLGQIKDLTKKADEGFEGKATAEFEKRLENIRAQLQQIKGNVDQIIVNVANSGVAAPVVALVEGLRAATSVLREVTQLLNLIPKGFVAAAASAAVLVGVIRGIRAISSAGGIGGALRGLEERFLPGQALARQDLEERRGGRPGGRGLAGVGDARIRTEQVIIDRLRAVGAQRIAAEQGRAALSTRAGAAFDRAGDAAARIRQGVSDGVRSGLAAGIRATVTRPIVDPFRASIAAGRTFASPAAIGGAALARAQNLGLGLAGGIVNSRLVGAAGDLRAFGPGALAQANIDRAATTVVGAGDRAARAISAPFRALETALTRLQAALAAEVGLVNELGARQYTRNVLGGQALTDVGHQVRQGALGVLGRDYTLPLAQRAAPITNAFNAARGNTATGPGSLAVAGAAAARAAFAPAGRALTTTISQAYYKTGEIARASLASVQGVGRSLSAAFLPLVSSSARLRGLGLSPLGNPSQLGIPQLPAGPSERIQGGGLLSSAGRGIAKGLGAVTNFVGGPIGIAIIGATIASELNSAANSIRDAQKNLDELKKTPDVAAGETARTYTSEELAQRAGQFKTARQIADDSRSGFFGSIANFATGGAGTRAVADAELNTALTEAEGARAKAAEARVAAARVNSSNPGYQIDSTSAEAVSSSLQQLAQSGRSAAFQMVALKASIDLITKSGKRGTTFLDAAAQQRVASAGGEQATQFIQQAARPKFQYRDANGKLVSLPADKPLKPEDFSKIFEPAGPGGGFITRPGVSQTPGFTFSTDQFKKLQDVTNQTILADQKKGVDLGDEQGKQQLAQDLKKAYEGLLPGDQLTAAALAAAQGAADQAAELSTVDAKIAALQQDAIDAVQVANAKAQEAGNKEKLRALTTGTQDKSPQVTANTGLAQLLDARRRLVAGYRSQGLSNTQITAALEGLDNQITAARIAKVQADNELIKQEIDENQKARDVALAGAKTAAQKRRIALGFFKKDIKLALKSGDAELIRSVMAAASASEIADYRKALDDLIAAHEADAAAEAVRNKALADLAAASTIPSPVAPGAAPPPNFSGPGGIFRPPPGQHAAKDQVKKDKDLRKAFRDATTHVTPSAPYYGGSPAKDSASTATAAQIDAALAAAAAERQRNSLAAARAAIQKAQADYDAAKDGSIEQANALQALYAAKNAYADALRATASAARHVGEFKNSAVQQARLALKDAAANLHVFAKGTPEYYAAINAYIQAQRDLAEATRHAFILHLQANSDLTNPVTQANLRVREARGKLAHDRALHAPRDVIDQDKIDLKNSQNDAESAAFNQRLSDAKTNDELGRISHTAYLQYLQHEHDRLTKIKHKTRQQKDELNEIDQAIKAANEQLSGQFNIGDIKVPTIYEVRRAITNATGSNVSAIQNSVVNNNQQVTINGADFAKVVDYLKTTLGPAGSARLSIAPRKG